MRTDKEDWQTRLDGEGCVLGQLLVADVKLKEVVDRHDFERDLDGSRRC